MYINLGHVMRSLQAAMRSKLDTDNNENTYRKNISKPYNSSTSHSNYSNMIADFRNIACTQTTLASGKKVLEGN
jgi:hypothetical protein